MSINYSRMEREDKTVRTMIKMYCQGQHGTKGGLCVACEELADYATQRLEKCPFQEGKTTCAKCPVHCYKSDMREKVRTVMRYAGPRMLFRHPIMALFHTLDGLRDEPTRPEKAR